MKSENSILKTSYLVYLYHFYSLNLIFSSLKPLLNLSLTKSTLQLKSTLLYVDRPDTYSLIDFISYLFEFGFINFFGPTLVCFNDRTKTLRQATYRTPLNQCTALGPIYFSSLPKEPSHDGFHALTDPRWYLEY